MNKTALAQALEEAFKRFKARYDAQRKHWRTNPTPPTRYAWLIKGCNAPKGYVEPLCSDSNTPLDVLARTFCAIEALDRWLDRVEAGEKRHQETLNNQAGHLIVRLQTAAAFTETKT